MNLVKKILLEAENIFQPRRLEGRPDPRNESEKILDKVKKKLDVKFNFSLQFTVHEYPGTRNKAMLRAHQNNALVSFIFSTLQDRKLRIGYPKHIEIPSEIIQIKDEENIVEYIFNFIAKQCNKILNSEYK